MSILSIVANALMCVGLVCLIIGLVGLVIMVVKLVIDNIKDQFGGDFVTYREAANRIEEHIQIHYKNEYPHAVLITEALQMAMTLLRERANLENCSKAIRKGDAIWYVDFESGEIEEREVFSIQFKDGRIDSFSVDFKETGNFDEFVGDAIGDCFFISKEMAESALANGHGIK